VKAYNRYLRDLIISGKAKPSFVVSHEIDIDDAPSAYEKFDKRIEGYTSKLNSMSNFEIQCTNCTFPLGRGADSPQWVAVDHLEF
jgi:hypothetical protein